MFVSLMILAFAAVQQVEGPVREGPVPNPAKEVALLVKQLNAATAAERDAAEKQLLAMGAKVLPLLPTVATVSAPELKVRLARIRNQLEKVGAVDSAKGSRVTLQGKSLKLQEALAAITKQTGNKFVDLRGNMGQETTNPEVDLDLKDLPFWEAVDKLLDEADMTTYGFGTGGDEKEPDNKIGIINRPEGELLRAGRASYAGPFRVSATRVDATRDLNRKNGGLLRLSLNFAWEPRLRPIVIDLPASDLRIVDELEGEIAVANPEAEMSAEVQADINGVDFEIPLTLPSREVRKIGSVQGKLVALVPGRVESFEFALPKLDPKGKTALPKEQRSGGVTVQIFDWSKNVETYQVEVRVKFDEGGEAFASHRNWILNNEAYLVDPKGERIGFGSYETTVQNNTNEVGVSYKFPLEGVPEGYKFVYRTPAAIVKLPISFKLKDLPLP